MKTVLVAIVLLLSTSALAQVPTPVPEKYCGPLIANQPGEPDVKCGRLCWKEKRKFWLWTGCKNVYDVFAGKPTPFPGCPPGQCRGNSGGCIPCPFSTPTPTVKPGPTPCTADPCTCGWVGWCQTWMPATDTVLCARCK